jgi:hypothetical protein
MNDRERDALIRDAQEQISILENLIRATNAAIARTKRLLAQIAGNHDQLPGH